MCDINFISNTIKEVIYLSPFITYDEYINVSSSESVSSSLQLAKERGLSLSLGPVYIQPFLQMKHNFKDWYIHSLSDSKRKAFVEFVIVHRQTLLHRLEEATERRFSIA